MTFGNAESNSPDPDASRERLDLETRVLAAALRQSLERGDTEGSSHAHQQIFVLLKASQEMGWEEPISLPIEVVPERKRQLPDIDWGAPEEDGPHKQESEAGQNPQDELNTVPVQNVQAESLINPVDSLEITQPELSTDEQPEVQLAVHLQQGAVQANATPAGSSSHQAPEAEAVEPEPEELLMPDAAILEIWASPVVDVGFSNGGTFPSATGADMEVSGNHSLSAFIPVTFIQSSATTVLTDDSLQSISDYYGHLAVSQTSDFNTIHKSFLRRVRPLLRRQLAEQLTGAPRKQLLGSLQALWIAHDILCDPVTRTDYDFRRMGLRGGNVAGDPSKAALSLRPQLRIGELLQCAGLLETTELEIAADMHKAMPELMFGAFLVKQGFIADEDLTCVLLGQQLLKTGGITVAQFQDAMTERATTGGDVGIVLVARHYLTEAELQEAYKGQCETTEENIPIFSATVSLQASELDVAEALNSDDDDDQSMEEAQENLNADLNPDLVPNQKAGSETISQSKSETGELGQPEHTENTQVHFGVPFESLTSDYATASNSPASNLTNGTPETLSDDSASSDASLPDLSQTVPPQEGASTSRRLNLGNAVPSWKDQLDWSSPEETEIVNNTASGAQAGNGSNTTGLNGEPLSSPAAPDSSFSLASFYQTTPSRADTVELPSQHRNRDAEGIKAAAAETKESGPVQPTAGEAERKPKRSLIDLMVGLDNIEPKREEEVTNHSMLSNVLQSSVNMGDATTSSADTSNTAAAQAGDDYAPPMLDEEDISAVADEFAALDAAAEEAMSISHISEPTLREDKGPVFTPAPHVVAAKAREAAAVKKAREAARDAAREEANVSAEMQKESGSWQIVSIPASALASLLLDDEEEEQSEFNAKSKTTEFEKKPGETKNPPGGQERRGKKRKTRS